MKTEDQIYNLFEYDKPLSFEGTERQLNDLDSYLDEIWEKREKSVLNFWQGEDEELRKSTQQFIEFSRKNNTLRSGKYVGIISFDGKIINLLPKIFNDNQNGEYQTYEVEAIQSHILWWLSYCSKFKFPKASSSYSSLKSNFFEVLIYLYAKYTRQILNNYIFHGFQEIHGETRFMRGRLNINRYVAENLSTANWHKLNCIYDAFEMDNDFNRIIKYVSNLLFQTSQNSENKKLLREIVFILDEVSDQQCSIYDCEKIKLNPLFQEMFTVLDYCKLFLANSTVLSYKHDFKVFAFLLPMEYIFEDFVYGFIDREIGKGLADSQTTGKYLTEDDRFNLRPDLVINIPSKGHFVIADTKYKIIDSDTSKDKKLGISQGDLYQMLAYAIRLKCTEIKLLYPNHVQDFETSGQPITKFRVLDEFSGKLINIKVYRLPLILENWKELKPKKKLDQLFSENRDRLKEVLEEVLIE